jgi:DNA invertase Pin-like site-specific DNA recombinase
MNIGYIRVSTIEQNEERQTKALEKYGIEKYFSEKVSAKDTNRPKLKEMIEFAREGDNIYIHDFSRLARSTKDLLEIIEILKNKKINLISNKENLDTGTATGMLMLTVISAINQFERENMLERQREGIAIAKAKGKYKGKKAISKPDNWNEIYSKWKKREMTAIKACKELGLKRNTFYKFVNEEKETNNHEQS